MTICAVVKSLGFKVGDKVYIDNGFNYYWATKEDAQKALDAMLIYFEQ